MSMFRRDLFPTVSMFRRDLFPTLSMLTGG